jgi:hypothetical protein
MARPEQTENLMSLGIEKTVPGVAHSLEDKKSKTVDAKTSKSGEPLAFDFPIRIATGDGKTGPKFYGEQVRSEGPERRFVYIGIGEHAGQKDTCWSRRMKIDIHTIPQTQLDKAAKGKTLEAVINGTGKDGSPACATIQLLKPWRAV